MFNPYQKLNQQTIINLTNNYRHRLANPFPLSRIEVARSISKELLEKQNQGLIPIDKANQIRRELGV